jgi:hypothetical protein
MAGVRFLAEARDTPQRADLLNLLFKGYWDFFSGVKRAFNEHDDYLRLVSRSRIMKLLLLSHMSSRRGAK